MKKNFFIIFKFLQTWKFFKLIQIQSIRFFWHQKSIFKVSVLLIQRRCQKAFSFFYNQFFQYSLRCYFKNIVRTNQHILSVLYRFHQIS
mgnify:CR=1 FL=1